MFKTRITDMLGIEYPIIGGGMALLSRAQLVAAISNAGGLGILVSSAFEGGDGLRQEIRRTKELTDKPFGVNIGFFPSVRDMPTDDYFQACIDEKIALIETAGGGSPAPYVPGVKDAGIVFMHKCTQVRHAVAAEKAGVDMVAVVGWEGGGAKGPDDIGTLVLVPTTVDAVDIPVVAAGGISDSRGFVAAMALGAEAVLLGTRFMATQECQVHANFKNALTEAMDTDTIIIERTIRNTHRHWRNSAALKVAELEERGAGLDELLTVIRGENTVKIFNNGELDAGVVSLGQGVGMVHDVPTVKEVIDSMVKGAQEITGQMLPERIAQPR
jgi:nitronate monooxygenase